MSVLAEKIDNLHMRVDDTNKNLCSKIDGIHKRINEEIKPEVKQNTEFRLKATGIMGILGVVAGIVGAGIFWILDKILKK